MLYYTVRDYCPVDFIKFVFGKLVCVNFVCECHVDPFCVKVNEDCVLPGGSVIIHVGQHDMATLAKHCCRYALAFCCATKSEAWLWKNTKFIFFLCRFVAVPLAFLR